VTQPACRLRQPSRYSE